MAKAPTAITASTVIRGRVSGQEDVDLLGRIEGQIDIEGTLNIDAKARADADVKAANVYVHGILIGNTSAQNTIHLTETAQVIGDLVAPRIIVDDGARIRGLVDMGGSGSTDRSTTKRTAKPAAAPAPAADQGDDDDSEPSLPATARKKKVTVKKRG